MDRLRQIMLRLMRVRPMRPIGQTTIAPEPLPWSFATQAHSHRHSLLPKQRDDEMPTQPIPVEPSKGNACVSCGFGDELEELVETSPDGDGAQFWIHPLCRDVRTA